MSDTLYVKASRRVAARYLSAAPLDDFRSMPSNRIPQTVGWGLEQNLKHLERVTSFFQSRKDSWAIIVKPDAVSFDDVRDYVDRTPKLKRSKIIVVENDAMEGDDTHPDFTAIHDIIGHGIEFESNNDSFGDINYLVPTIHWYLPEKYKIQDQDSDKGPDVLAALFFYVNPKDLIDKVVRDLARIHKGAALDKIKESVESGIGLAVMNVARWSSKFRPGVPRMVQIW
jgi:hypothetical protein